MTVSLPIKIFVRLTPSGINLIHQRQSHVTLICSEGKRLTKAVESVKGGRGCATSLKSDGRGTIERLDGTRTASQLPT